MFCVSLHSDMQIFDRIRGQDIRLLKMFKVGFIFDLMLEQKKVKFGMKLVHMLFTSCHSVVAAVLIMKRDRIANKWGVLGKKLTFHDLFI